MSGKAKIVLTILAMVLALGVLAPVSADVAGRPHDLTRGNRKGRCLNCHDLHQTALGEGFAHNLKKSNEIDVCYQCHSGVYNNYSAIEPSLPNRTALYSYYDIRSEFDQTHVHFPAYGMDGEKNRCSGCHNPHGVLDNTSTTRRPKLLSAGPDAVTDTDEFCFVCHNSDQNPPHQKFSNISVGSQYRFSRTTYRQMTHSTFFRATTLDEPVPDTSRTYDDNPYGKGKDISCLTCHRPHGSPNDHMLKSPDNQDLCLACHDGSRAASLTAFTSSGHGRSGIRRICQDCHFPHGTGQENAVKKSIKDPHTNLDNTVLINYSGMDAACYACHGAPSAGKYYLGKTVYKAGIHKTSANSHNAKDTAGDQAAGDCDNCHNPHGRGYGKMLVDPRDQTLCYDCHNETTHNTQGGKDVKAAFEAMSSRHDMTKVKCVNCHNVHSTTRAAVRMNPYKPQSTISDAKAFCLKCHSGTMPSGVTGAQNVSPEWTNGGHDRTHKLTCADCHDSHGSPNSKTLNYEFRTYSGKTASFGRGMKLSRRAFCEACHDRASKGYKGAKVIPTGALYVAQHDQGDTTPCSNCHNKKHDPALSSYTGSGLYYTTSCLNCHKQGVGNPYPDADAEFNTPANASDANTRKSIHDITYSPPAAVDCVRCHGPKHETDHSVTVKVFNPDTAHPTAQSLDIRTSSAFCLQCHDATPVGIGGKSPMNIIDTYTSAGHGKSSAGRAVCYACHEYHGSANDKLIMGVIDGSAVLSTYSGNNVSVCTACHKGVKPNTPQWSGYSVYSGSMHAFGNHTTGNLVTDGRHGPGVCVNCHNPHGARVSGQATKSMLYKKEEDLCYTCHASGFDNFSTPGDYNNKWNRFGGVLSVKKEGGALHFGPNSVGQKVSVYDGLDTSFVMPDRDGTITVRMKVPAFSRSDGHEKVGIRLDDSRDPSNSVQLFYRATPPIRWVCRFGNNSSVVTTTLPTSYKTLKLVRNKAANTVDAYVDATTVKTGAPFSAAGYVRARLFCYIGGNNDATAESVEAWFDDFRMTYTAEGSVHNTASGDDVQARFYMKTHHNISDSDQSDGSKVECKDCHDPHTLTKSLMAFKDISDAGGRKVVPIEADQEFCIKCHSPSPPTGVKYPAGGVWDKTGYLDSAHGNPLKRYRAFGNYSNNVTYPCKVCHNPHGSDQAALQRESWDFDRDGIPDDIDGDGVLDSTGMVGFIGYSTGTRKAILVRTMREGFRRISSTIPYQGNGVIDVELCLNCHDGTPAPDVEKDFEKPSHHDVTYADQTAGGGSKIECYNCHDQHRAQARNDAQSMYPTTNPDPPREPMPGDAPFCLKCHDNTLPAGVSFGNKTGGHRLKNIKLSYNPDGRTDSNGYDRITSYKGHYVQADGAPMMCRDCHNQHGSNYSKMLRDDTEPSRPGHDPSQPIQGMQPVALRESDPMGGGDGVALSTTVERCLACHSGGTTFNGNLLPLPPPPDSAERGFPMSAVGKHPDLKPDVTTSDVSNGHIYRNAFSVITSPGSIKEACTACHDSHNPYIATVEGQLTNCYQCHNENTSLPDVQSEFNDNPTNPTRSKSIHPIRLDPSGTTPSYVECLKCHDQTKHMQGRVRLRKDPSRFINYTSDNSVWTDPVDNRTVNQFCLECHAPDTTVASSFWKGGTEHVPPMLPAGHADGAHFINGSLLCTDCHEYHGSRSKGLRKNARGDEEALCFSCHRDPAKSRDGVNIMSKFTSVNARHNVDAAGQYAAGSKVECEDCHNPHTVTRTYPVVSPVDKVTLTDPDESFCTSCHGASGVQGVKFPGYSTGSSGPEWDTVTGKWNRWNKAGYAGYSSHSRRGVVCSNCHDPHGSRNYAMLLTNVSTAMGKGTGISVSFGIHSTIGGKRREEVGVNRLCSTCHKSQDGVYDGYSNFTSLTFGKKNGPDKNCTYCHNPHGSSQDSMVRSARPVYMNMTSSMFGSVYNFKGFGNSTTGKPFYTFCSSAGCHRGTGEEGSRFDVFNLDGNTVDNTSGDETTTSHHPVKEGTIGCISCHKEHGSTNAPDLRAPYYRQGNWPSLWHNSGSGMYAIGGGTVSSRPHYYASQSNFDGRNYFEYYRNTRSAIVNTNVPDNGNDLCFMCHQKEDVTGDPAAGMANANTNFRGHEAVKGGATCSQDISLLGNGVGSDYHNFTCSMCHYAHSSRKGKLLKHSCFSQLENQAPYTGDYALTSYGSISVFSCHPYRSWSNWVNKGWRRLTMTKADFKRPPNPVNDLTGYSDPDLTVHLNWSAVEDAPGQKADHYNVYRYTQAITQAAKPYATRMYKGTAGSGGNIGSSMSYTDPTTQPNTAYYYAVVACDSENNESLVGNCAQVSLGPDTLRPSAVSDQTLAQVDGTDYVKLTWHDPGDNVNAVQYKIFRKAQSSPLADSDLLEVNRASTVPDTSLSPDGSGYPVDATLYSYTDNSALAEGTEYSYAVAALDAGGNISLVPTGSAFTITIVDPPPAAITDLTAKPVSGAMQALLSWSAPADVGTISGYNVYRKAGSALGQSDLVSGNKIASLAPGLTYTDNVPASGIAYYYAVTAVDQSSGKEASISNTGASVNIPAAPAGLTAARMPNNSMLLNWSAPAVTTNLSHYRVYKRRDGGAWTRAPIGDKSTNLITAGAGSFEGGLGTAWIAAHLTGAAETGMAYEGSACLKITATENLSDQFVESATLINVSSSTMYTYSAYVYIPAALGNNAKAALRVIEYNSSNTVVTEHMAPGLNISTGWQRLVDTWTTNASTVKVRLRLQTPYTGTVYWDDARLAVSTASTTSARLDLQGLQPGACDVAVTAYYTSYGGTSPYEIPIPSAGLASFTLGDSRAADHFNVTASLTPTSYNVANLAWNVPADNNYTGYGAVGLDYYRIQATYDLGKTWSTILRTRLTNPGFESFTGTADDANADTMADWTSSAAYVYAVTDPLFDSYAVKIRYTGSGDRYIYAAEPNTGQSVANQTYSMSFWARASKDTSFQYFIQENGGGGQWIGTSSPSIGTGWQRFTASGTFTSGATATSARVVIRPSSDTTAEIYVDGVRLDTGSTTIGANDGSYCQPAGYETAGSPQSFDDPRPVVAGTSARYRIQSVDTQGNVAGMVFSGTLYAKPTPISDLTVSSSATTSANALRFTTPVSLPGVTRYWVYAKEQSSALSSTTGAVLLTPTPLTPGMASWSNLAVKPAATATANYTWSAVNPAGNVRDGNYTTYWEGRYGNVNTATIDLGSQIPVGRAALTFYGSSWYTQPKDYQIQTSTDNVNWATQVTVTGNTSAGTQHTFAAATARYVRIYITDVRGNISYYNPIICEFEVYPSLNEQYVHDILNTALRAEQGHTYAYAVIAEDANGLRSDISSGSPTVNQVQDKDGPDKVTDLTVSSPAGWTKVMLRWSKPLDNKGYGTGTGATSYKIYRLPTSSVGTPVPVTDANYASASLEMTGTYPPGPAGTFTNYTATWYDHKGAYYAVRSADSAGNWSAVSDSPFVTVGKDIQAPTPPVISECRPVTSPEVDVYWAPATDNVDINGYRLYRADADIEPFLTDGCITENNVDQAVVAISLIPYNASSAADTGGTSGKRYYYALKAWDSENNVSNISNCGLATVATTDADAAPPTWSGTPLTATQGEYPDIDLIWTAASDLNDAGGAGSIDHYDIYMGPASFSATTEPGVAKVATISGIRLSYVDNTGSPDTTYYYALTASDASTGHNKGALSNVVSATVASRPSPDNTPPTVPGGLAAATGVYPYINLSWTGSTDEDDGHTAQPLNYYKLYRSDYPADITDADKDNPTIVKTFIIAHDAVSYVAMGSGGAKYNYRLEAFDMAGNGSGLGGQVMGQVASAPCVDTTAPSAPAGLAASVGPTPDMALSWTASADSGCPSVSLVDHYSLYKANYEITAGTDLGTITPIFIPGNVSSYTDSSGAPNTQYWYALTAADPSGNESARSNIITKTTAADTMAPAAVADLKASQITGGGIQLTWCRPSDNVGVDHYEIYRKQQATILTDADITGANKLTGFTNGGSCLSYNDTGVTGGSSYSYAVIAVDGTGNRSTISRGRASGDTVAAAP